MHTFIGEYPDENNRIGGAMVRIKEIDDKFLDRKRQYLDIRFLGNLRVAKKVEYPTDNCSVYRYNFFRDFWAINKRIKESESIYIHTIYNYVKLMLPLALWFKKKPVALDIHGVIPEEQLFQGRKRWSAIYSFVEKAAFKRVNYAIHVTNAMRIHFHQKYPSLYIKNKPVDVLYGIIPAIQNGDTDQGKIEQLKEELGIKEGEVVFIYSGGLQKWQNIDLMLRVIKKLTDRSSLCRFIMLTNEKRKLSDLASAQGLEHRMHIASVLPEDLVCYYKIAHYGFVLRDDHVVNRVSNPTKLIEYLAFGITPVVLCPDIGDYMEKGYEYVGYVEIETKALSTNKSAKNQAIYKSYLQQNTVVSIPFEA